MSFVQWKTKISTAQSAPNGLALSLSVRHIADETLDFSHNLPNSSFDHTWVRVLVSTNTRQQKHFRICTLAVVLGNQKGIAIDEKRSPWVELLLSSSKHDFNLRREALWRRASYIADRKTKLGQCFGMTSDPTRPKGVQHFTHVSTLIVYRADLEYPRNIFLLWHEW